MKKTKTSKSSPKSNELAGEKLFRSKAFKTGSVDPFDDVNGKSNIDGYDRSELDLSDQSASPIEQDVEDMEGDEDFYGDDEENQGGGASYTGNQKQYLGEGDWADKQFGSKQYDHKGDVDYVNVDRKEVHAVTSTANRAKGVK